MKHKVDMADLSWLRFGQRSRTPVVPRSPTSSERASAHEQDDHRRPMPYRVSSYLSLNSASLNNRHSFSPEPLTPASNASFANTNTNLLVKTEDRVWHNPSLDQMVETLRVKMMTNGVTHPIPVECNSYVLHLIEGFNDFHERLEAANAACEDAKHARDQCLQDFKTVADEWSRQETQFKKEIKRLEVLLARTSRDGLETVTLARANSLVDRGGPDAKQFIRSLEKLRNQPTLQDSHEDAHHDFPGFFDYSFSSNTSVMRDLEKIEKGNERKLSEVSGNGLDSPLRGPRSKVLDRDNDFVISEKLRRHDAATAARAPVKTRRQTHRLPPHMLADQGLAASNATSPSVHPAQSPNVEKQSFTSSSSSNSSSSSSDGEPELPPWSGDRNESNSNIRQSGRFSFIPGDDTFRIASCEGLQSHPLTVDGIVERPLQLTQDIELRSYEQVRQPYQPANQPQGPPKYPLEFLKPSFSTDGLAAPSALEGRDEARQPYCGKYPNLGSSSKKSRGIINTGAFPDNQDEQGQGGFGLYSHDSTSSKNTVVRDGSGRSTQSLDYMSESTNTRSAVPSSPSPSVRPQTQRQSSAQIAAARAVARNNHRKESGSNM